MLNKNAYREARDLINQSRAYTSSWQVELLSISEKPRIKAEKAKESGNADDIRIVIYVPEC